MSDYKSERFYVVDVCQEHEQCLLVTPCTWNGPYEPAQHIPQVQGQMALDLAGWRAVTLQPIAPAFRDTAPWTAEDEAELRRFIARTKPDGRPQRAIPEEEGI